jgi:hypothetical protein
VADGRCPDDRFDDHGRTSSNERCEIDPIFFLGDPDLESWHLGG